MSSASTRRSMITASSTPTARSSRRWIKSSRSCVKKDTSYNFLMDQALTIAFFGISGSGKGTQAELLEKFLKENDSRGVVRPEMGSLLRAFMQSGTPLAGKTGEIVSSGGLVPSFMPIYLLTGLLNASFDGTQHLLLDGTCRRPDQS